MLSLSKHRFFLRGSGIAARKKYDPLRQAQGRLRTSSGWTGYGTGIAHSLPGQRGHRTRNCQRGSAAAVPVRTRILPAWCENSNAKSRTARVIQAGGIVAEKSVWSRESSWGPRHCSARLCESTLPKRLVDQRDLARGHAAWQAVLLHCTTDLARVCPCGRASRFASATNWAVSAGNSVLGGPC